MPCVRKELRRIVAKESSECVDGVLMVVVLFVAMTLQLKRIHSHISEKALKELKALSNKNGRKVADMVRQAIHEYIRRESK